jgi:hypothetical protein
MKTEEEAAAYLENDDITVVRCVVWDLEIGMNE